MLSLHRESTLQLVFSHREAIIYTIAGSSYHAVVMDFGSCQEAQMNVQNRSEALAVQEDAEARP